MPRYDPLSKSERSRRMAAIRDKNTSPEMFVRGIVSSLGYRYKLHASNLPGKPDLVFPKLHKAIFVHGCFWHQHGCNQYRMPLTRKNFWEPKLGSNVKRDKRKYRQLGKLGWKKLVLWECQLTLKNSVRVTKRIQRFITKDE